ncbi:protein MMS22-like [Hypomesus transpacificus]|uniref:protein MMS22-like n=1 Tax=Hypomesus transpacificus TaxID=137520 RepID=UPI001F07BE2F|nr:protein MMS22-like [Hypomesus transpacificus]XP_046875218.1 protein MMS22-like [Hypomesus transpacificus]
MDEDFNQSLTPPVSPFAAESSCSLAPARPPCFGCFSESGRENTLQVSPDAYIGRGSLKRLLLRLDPAPADYESDTVELFGFLWVTETALVESTQLLFGLFRQKVFKLETLVQSSSHDFGQASGLHYEAEDLRHQCVQFLQYVKVFLYRYLSPPRPEQAAPHPYEALQAVFPSALLEELFGLSLLIGRLSDMPASVQAAFTMQHMGKLLPPTWHLLHLHLDLHWSLLELLHLLGHKMQGQVVYVQQDLTGENVTDVSLLEQQLTNLLCDLTSLAISKYCKVRPTEAQSSQPYLCSCSRELWIQLIHLVEHRSKVLHTPSFWSYMNTLLRPLMGGPRPESGQGAPLPPCKDALGFSWWLVTHLAELGQYGRSGSLQTEKQLEDNWSLVGGLLRASCNPKGGLQEEQVRMHVHCCLSVCLMWGPNTSTVSILWEYYSRHLGGSFSVPWLGVSSLGSMSRSPLALLEQARSCCEPGPLRSAGHAQLYRHASSFLLFLRILALYLAQDSAPWRQIKGRVYSKFHQRRMQELSEAGLAHFLLLFLVVALRAEPEDVAGRACELLGLLPWDGPPTQRGLVWRGQLALLLLLQDRGLDVGPQACWLADSFSKSAREFYLRTTEPSRRLALWPPLASYLEGVAEVFETSRALGQSEERLLNEGFGLLLPACRQTELGSALGFLQVVLSQLRRVHQRGVQAGPSVASVGRERHLAVAAALWTHFFPFLRSLRLTQTPPAPLADAAAGFTLLAFDLPSSAPQDLQPNPVQSIMHCFGWEDMLHPLLVTRYLPHLLQDSELVVAVSSGSGASASGPAQALCVRAWFRCFLQQHLHKNPDRSDSRAGRALEEQLAELTRLVLRLPEVDSLLQRSGLQPAASRPEPRSALQLFIKAVGRVYGGLQVLSERAAMVTKALDYLGDFLKHVKPYLVNKNPEGLQLAYWVGGCVVKHWGPLLASSRAQQQLFRLVEVLLLPHSLTHLEQALRDSLPLYLQGLSVAAGMSQSQGAGLKQQLRSVIAKYLDHFLPATPSAGVIANHPVLLAACEATPTPHGAGLRRSILQVLCDNFLQFKGHAPPPRLAAVLAFLLELLRRNKDADPALLTVPLPSVLRCLMLVNEPHVRRIATEALQLLVERCGAATDGPCNQTTTILKSFVEENEGVYDKQVYSVLETVAVLDLPVVQVLVPVLSLSLRNTEHKRGLGRNSTLRSAYKKLLSILGDVGQAEAISLEEE